MDGLLEDKTKAGVCMMTHKLIACELGCRTGRSGYSQAPSPYSRRCC